MTAGQPHNIAIYQDVIPRHMNVRDELPRVLDDASGLRGRALAFTPQTQLLGSLPELDSMAVVAVIASLEDRFGIVVDDDDIDSSTFTTAGSPVKSVNGKLAP